MVLRHEGLSLHDNSGRRRREAAEVTEAITSCPSPQFLSDVGDPRKKML